MYNFFALALLSAAMVTVVEVESKLSQAEIDSMTDNFIEQIRPYRNHIKEWAYGLAVDREQTKADYLTCEVCHPALELARPLLESGGTEEELTNIVTWVCEKLHLAPSDDMCYLTIKGYVTPIAYMLLNDPDMSNDDFCGFINEGCGTVNPAFYNWETDVDPGRPTALEPPPLPENVGRTKILQFTDLHLDLDYVEGTSTNCSYPMCCREVNGKPSWGEKGAGKYGHGRCGLPYAGMAEMFRRAAEKHDDAKYILLTGDYIHSGVWLYNETENERHISNVTQTLRQYFPDTTVIIVTGNHETPTVNMYPPLKVTEDRFNLRWMYQAMSQPFQGDMGGDAQIADFLTSGYYTVSPQPGLRFVILNTNICYIQNFWLPHDTLDPFRQLDWFSKTMAAAETANEKVIIVSHIPPGSSACWKHWSNQWDRVINRYAHIVPFQVYGHTHNEFYIVTLARESTQDKPIIVGFTGPSAVAEGAGVAYKVYYADGERETDSTWELIDHETWILNTIKSHDNDNNPEWYLGYRASETFGLKTQRPAEYYGLTQRMVSNQTLFERFRRVYLKDGNTDFAPCPDIDCVSEIICHTVDYNAADRSACNRFKYSLENGEDGSGTVRTALSSSWSIMLMFTLMVNVFRLL